MAAEPADAPPPPRSAPRGLLAAGLEALRTRLDLAAVELEIHLLVLMRMLLWAVAALVCALLALAFGVTALVAALWDSHRLLGLLAGSLTFVALAVVCGVSGARAVRNRGGILAGSLRELDRDRERAGAPP
ncbi:MAG TPA: phage holin family protein [Steroidobacteraceae bacterium]|nr:phage holin family protein [Steroidobacteraceae bacterium]